MTTSNDIPAIATFQVGSLCAQVYGSSQSAGAAAACVVAAEIRRLIATRGRAVGIFASAPSQNEFLDELVNADAVEWTRVIAFHLSEYVGLREDAPQSMRKYLLDRLVMRVPIVEFHGLRGEAANPEAVCVNYAALLKSRQPDFAIVEVEENGNLAFIDPAANNFQTSAAVKIIELNEGCRQQQVLNGAFSKLELVPAKALSLTIETILACEKLFLIAAGKHKQKVICNLLETSPADSCPASILHSHPNVHLFLDRDAAYPINAANFQKT